MGTRGGQGASWIGRAIPDGGLFVNIEAPHAASRDPRVQGVRAFLDKLATDRRVVASAAQTLGTKGWDGFAVAVVR
jgi:predicted O-methyltransferase YrrM